MIAISRPLATALLALGFTLLLATARPAAAQETPAPVTPATSPATPPVTSPVIPPVIPAPIESTEPPAVRPLNLQTVLTAPGDPPPPIPGAAAAPAPAPPPPPAPAAAPPAEHLDFDLTFPQEKGGGSASGSAGNLEYQRDDYAVLTGDVKIKYKDIDLQADRAEIDLSTKLVTATGHVIVDQANRRMAGDTLTFNLGTKTGTVTNASAQVSPDYYFTGREIAKVGDDTYTVVDGIFTSCNQHTPDWSFRLKRATVEAEGYAHVHNASMRVKKLPIFYTPYILWPVKSDRASGFLVPNVGYSEQRGAEVGLAYYQTLGRSADTTFHLDTFTKNYLGFGDELRYHPTEGTKGTFVGYAVQDPVDDELRWKLELNHTTDDLPWGMRGVIAYQDFSDFNFFKDFERDFDRNTQRSIVSRAFATGNWGPHLLNILLDDRDTFVSLTTDVVQRKLPEIEYRLRSTQLGRTPFYLSGQSSIDYLDIDRQTSYSGSYGRVDLFPQISLPISSIPWLSLSVAGGERVTYYGDSLDTTGQRFTGDSLTRTLPVGSAEIVGPSLSRIFSFGSGKVKHIFQPRWTYNYQGDVEDPQEIPLFDEVDTPRSTNAGRLALSNRFLSKAPDDGSPTAGSVREFFFFEVARNYSFDSTQPLQFSRNGLLSTQEGPLEALLRYNPTATTSVQAAAAYSTLFSGLASTSLSANLGLGQNSLGLTWFTSYQPELGTTLSNQVRLSGAVVTLARKLRLEGQFNYDVEERLLQQQRIIGTYTGQCYGVSLELRDFRAGVGSRVRDKDIRLSISLKNVGTFIDLTGRSQTVQP